MTPEDLRVADQKGLVKLVPPLEVAQTPDTKPSSEQDLDAIINSVRSIRRHLTTAPGTKFVPKTFADQIQFYDDGTNRRLYLYINNTWRYVTLT